MQYDHSRANDANQTENPKEQPVDDSGDETPVVFDLSVKINVKGIG